MRQANRLLGSGSRKTGCFGCTLEAGKSWCPSLKTGRQEEFFLCVLFGTSTNWVRTTTLEKVTCFPQPIDVLLNINFIQKPLHRDTEDNVWAPCDPVKLTNKISHHNTLAWLWSYIPILMSFIFCGWEAGNQTEFGIFRKHKTPVPSMSNRTTSGH